MRPPRLRPGDTVGIVSPSWGGAARFPHRVARGTAQLEAMGFRVRMARHALADHGAVSDTAEHRAADLHELFADADVRAVVAAIGGDHSCQLLPHLDFDLIGRHPTILVGYSDVTVLNVAIWARTGLVTFNGPALLTDFAEYPGMPDYTLGSFLRTVTVAEPVGPIAPSDWWTEELLEWGTQQDLTRARTRLPSPGWTWLRDGTADGVLVGGCLESLQHLRGTPYWPDFAETILFLETSEERPAPSTVDALLSDYENMGVFERLHGLLVGRPMRYTDDEKRELRDVVRERTRRWQFPIVMDMDFGHTAPQFVLPVGCRARIDGAGRRVELVEPAVC